MITPERQPWSIFAACAVSLAIGFGCASGGFSYDDLPASPVVIAVRSEDDTSRFEETVKRETERRFENRQKPPIADPLLRLAYRVEDMVAATENRARFTRLTFYDAIEREGERVEFAARGARPLDWDADRRRLLYAAESNGRSQLFEWIKATGEVRQVTFDQPHLDGAYGPDGRIAVVRSNKLQRDGDRAIGGLQIYLAESGGANPVQVTAGPMDLDPTWSPDGRLLVYESWDANAVESIQSLDVTTPSLDVAPKRLARGRMPDFTPDGTWIVYSARTRAGYKLFKMHTNGKGRRSLGRSAYQELDPSVSPDGRYVVFVGINPNSEAGPQLMVKRLAGSNARQLSLEGAGLVPVW